MDIFTLLIYQPLYNLFVFFYLTFGNNLGIAILLLAVVTRLIVWPLTRRQLGLSASSKELSEKMDEIKKKYKNDEKKRDEEVLKLNSEYMPTILGGCLSLPIQLIFLINVYNIISSATREGVTAFNQVAYSFIGQLPADKEYISEFLGLNLFQTPQEVLAGGEVLTIVVTLILLAGVVITQYLSFKAITARNSIEEDENKKAKKKDDKKGSDFAEAFKQSAKLNSRIFPLMIGLFAFYFPTGIGLYLLVVNAFVIIQQYFINRNKLKK